MENQTGCAKVALLHGFWWLNATLESSSDIRRKGQAKEMNFNAGVFESQVWKGIFLSMLLSACDNGSSRDMQEPEVIAPEPE